MSNEQVPIDVLHRSERDREAAHQRADRAEQAREQALEALDAALTDAPLHADQKPRLHFQALVRCRQLAQRALDGTARDPGQVGVVPMVKAMVDIIGDLRDEVAQERRARRIAEGALGRVADVVRFAQHGHTVEVKGSRDEREVTGALDAGYGQGFAISIQRVPQEIDQAIDAAQRMSARYLARDRRLAVAERLIAAAAAQDPETHEDWLAFRAMRESKRAR